MPIDFLRRIDEILAVTRSAWLADPGAQTPAIAAAESSCAESGRHQEKDVSAESTAGPVR